MNIIIVGTLFCLLGSVKASSHWLTADSGNLYYFQLNHKYNWYEAVHACARLDMSLLAIDSAEKKEELYKVIKDSGMSMTHQFWIAGHDNAVDGQYAWITTGENFGYTQWMGYEPNSEYEHCVELALNQFKWNDVRCIKLRGYICEENRAVKKKERLISQQTEVGKKNAKENSEKLKESLKALEEYYEKNFNTLMADKTKEIDVIQKSIDEDKRKIFELTKQLDKKHEELETYKKLSYESTTASSTRKIIMSPWRFPAQTEI